MSLSRVRERVYTGNAKNKKSRRIRHYARTALVSRTQISYIAQPVPRTLIILYTQWKSIETEE